VQVWAWEKTITQKKGTMSYVIMFGYGKGLAHYMCSHVWLWERTNPFSCTYLGGFKGGFNFFSKNQHKQNANKNLIVWLWGFRLTLKGMKLLINKP
jgi:hypothetical protein